eukprot:gene17140-20381_t
MELLLLLLLLAINLFSPLIGFIAFAIALGWIYSSSIGAAAASVAATFNILDRLLRNAPAAWRAALGEEYESTPASRGLLYTSLTSSLHALAGPRDSFQREYAIIVIPCATVLFVSLLSGLVRLFGGQDFVANLWRQRKLMLVRALALVVGMAVIEDALALTAYGYRALSLLVVWRTLVGTCFLGLGARAPKVWAISTGFELAAALTLVVSPRLHAATASVSAWPSIAFGCGIAAALLSFDGSCDVFFGVAAHQLVRRHLLVPVASWLRTIVFHEYTTQALQRVMRLLRESNAARASMVKAALRMCMQYILRPSAQAVATAYAKLHRWILQPCWKALLFAWEGLLKFCKLAWEWLSYFCEVLRQRATIACQWLATYVLWPLQKLLVSILRASQSLFINWVLQPCWRGAVRAYEELVYVLRASQSLFINWVLQPLKKIAHKAAAVAVRFGNWIVSRVIRPLEDLVISCMREFLLLARQAWDLFLKHVLRPLFERAYALLKEVYRRTYRPVLLSIEPVLMLSGCVHFAHSAVSASSATSAAPFCLATAALTSVTGLVIGRSIPRSPLVIRHLGRALTLAGFWAYVSLDLWSVKAARALLTAIYTTSSTCFSMVANVVAVMRRAIWRFLSETIWPYVNAVLRAVGRAASSMIEIIWAQPLIAAGLAAGLLSAAYVGHRTGGTEMIWLSAGRSAHMLYAAVSALKVRVAAAISMAEAAAGSFGDIVGAQAKLATTRHAVLHMDSLLTSANSLAIFEVESFAWLTYAVVLASTYPVRASLLPGMNPEPMYSQAEIYGRAAVKLVLIPPIVVGWLDRLLPGAKQQCNSSPVKG